MSNENRCRACLTNVLLDSEVSSSLQAPKHTVPRVPPFLFFPPLPSPHSKAPYQTLSRNSETKDFLIYMIKGACCLSEQEREGQVRGPSINQSRTRARRGGRDRPQKTVLRALCGTGWRGSWSERGIRASPGGQHLQWGLP